MVREGIIWVLVPLAAAALAGLFGPWWLTNALLPLLRQASTHGS